MQPQNREPIAKVEIRQNRKYVVIRDGNGRYMTSAPVNESAPIEEVRCNIRAGRITTGSGPTITEWSNVRLYLQDRLPEKAKTNIPMILCIQANQAVITLPNNKKKTLSFPKGIYGYSDNYHTYSGSRSERIAAMRRDALHRMRGLLLEQYPKLQYDQPVTFLSTSKGRTQSYKTDFMLYRPK
jgi:hypothetical protein